MMALPEKHGEAYVTYADYRSWGGRCAMDFPGLDRNEPIPFGLSEKSGSIHVRLNRFLAIFRK